MPLCICTLNSVLCTLYTKVPLRYKEDVRSIAVAARMDQNETSTFLPTLSDAQLFHWGKIFNESLFIDSTSTESTNSTQLNPNFESSSSIVTEITDFTQPNFSEKSSSFFSLWQMCIFIIIGLIFLALILVLVLVYKRAHSELVRLLAIQSIVEKGNFEIKFPCTS